MVLVSLRRAHIRVEYSVSWLAAAAVLLVLSRGEFVLEWTAGQLGISYPPLALVVVAFCIFLVVFYRFSVIISDLKDSNIALAQRVAILQYQVESLHEESKATGTQ
jgi:hypothetical protein